MLNTADFLDVLHRLSLLEPMQLDALERKLQEQTLRPGTAAGELAQELVEQGWLTSYQIERLLDGRGRELLLGPYVVLDCLGKGGMGAVYKARHRKLERIHAVKTIRNDLLQTAGAAERFDREARAAAKLNHANVVLVHDAGEAEGVRYIAMEYVEGADLSRLVDEQGPLPIALACDYVRQAALGLQHISERGLVHRDIKPSNLCLQQAGSGNAEVGGVIKVLDLGLARIESGLDLRGGNRLTDSNAVMGTVDFLSPEQGLDAHRVDIRADLYSLGCTLYFLLTGQVPFPEGGLPQKLVAHQMHEPEPVDCLRPEVPKKVAAVVRKLMAKKPDERYQTPAEVAEVLATICAGLGRSPPPRPTRAPARPTGTAAPATQAPMPRAGRRHWHPARWLVLGAVGLLLTLLMGGYLMFKGWQPWITDPDAVARSIDTSPLTSAGATQLVPSTTAAVPPPTPTERVVPRQTKTKPPETTPAPPSTKPTPGQPKAFTNSAEMDFVWIEPGSFQMGSPKTEHKRGTDEVQHRVTLTKGFWMQTTLVTQKQWKAVMGQDNNPSHFKGDDLPVDTVSWKDAKELCSKLNAQENREQEDQKYRLPYEAEWEFAARAGRTTPFWQGETITTDDVNFDGNYPYRATDSKGELRKTTTMVKRFPANPWRLHDMGGNVRQWCEDWYGEYPKEELQNPRGRESGLRRVLRGGSWGCDASFCRLAHRCSYGPGLRCDDFGLRVVLPASARAR